jgi:carnitine-CoA ligase
MAQADPFGDPLPFPTREQCVLPAMLQRRAAQDPDEVFAAFENGQTVTFATLREDSLRVAAALSRLGVTPGDRVLSWLPNGADVLPVLFGICEMGAVYVPINTAYRGALLKHVVDNAQADVLIIHPGLYDRLDRIDHSSVKHVVVLGDRTPQGCLPGSLLSEPVGQTEYLCPESQPWDPFAIVYTSGTTGASKGVVTSYAHLWAMDSAFRGRFRAGDRFLLHLPMFHSGGMSPLVAALEMDGSVGVIEHFDRQRFWELLAKTGSNAVMLISAMVTLLLKEPPSEADQDNRLCRLFVAPFQPDATEFCARFGVGELYTQFNMTEISTPLLSLLNPTVAGTCGRLRTGVSARLVDQNDLPVVEGAVGELVLRTDLPWMMNSGYWANPEATATAWRNGWFHTGDAFRVDDEGNYFFVDRVKDTIRRRGENISSFEVESSVMEHPAVREAAAVAVPSSTAEDEVMVILVAVEDMTLEPVDLIGFLSERLPHFMVPRYIRIVDELPRTPTGKVMKKDLRTTAVPEDAWDRESEGIVLRRQRLGPASPRSGTARSDSSPG